MVPTLWPGDRLYVEPPTDPERPCQRGDIVVVVDPEAPDRWLIKRVDAASYAPPGPPASHLPRGSLSLRGDNSPESRDSRAFGPVPIEAMVGIVRERYWPPERRGPVR